MLANHSRELEGRRSRALDALTSESYKRAAATALRVAVSAPAVPALHVGEPLPRARGQAIPGAGRVDQRIVQTGGGDGLAGGSERSGRVVEGAVRFGDPEMKLGFGEAERCLALA